MPDFALAEVVLQVEHRNPGAGGGPTLRVCEAGQGGREWLRFDCFERGAHWHLDPSGRDEITSMASGEDAIATSFAALRGDLAGLLARAGRAQELPPDPEAFGAALDAAEAASRNPPADLDGVRPEDRRPSHGEKWSAYPEDVLPLWVADMDFPVAEPIRRLLRFLTERSDLGYPIHPAPTAVPELTVERMDRLYGWRPEARNVEILSDVVQGMYVALHQFTAPGDGVVVQTPIYAPFLGSVKTLQRRLVENPLRETSNGYRVDLEGLAAAVDDGTRAILLCNPHNPSGRVFTREELEGIARVALERDLLIVSDEIHQDLVYPGHGHVPIASLSPEVAARTITLTAASKAYNVAGLRCAVAIFGAAALKQRFCALPRHVRGGINVVGIEVLQTAWRHAGPWLDQVRDYLAANRDFVAETVRAELPGVVHHVPESTYLAWLDCRALGLEPDPYRFFLERGRVALSNGKSFGTPGTGFVRINFATSRAILAQGLERMAKALR